MRMGNQRRPGFSRIQPAWTQSVGALIDEGAEVRVYCSTCGYRKVADLAAIAAARGPGFSLWGKRSTCPTEGCQSTVWFSAVRPGSGAWPTNLKGD
jgi:hypothetical protein